MYDVIPTFKKERPFSPPPKNKSVPFHSNETYTTPFLVLFIFFCETIINTNLDNQAVSLTLVKFRKKTQKYVQFLSSFFNKHWKI